MSYYPVETFPTPLLRPRHHVVAPHPLVELARAQLPAPYPHVAGLAVLRDRRFVDARRRHWWRSGDVETVPQVVRRPVELCLRMFGPAALLCANQPVSRVQILTATPSRRRRVDGVRVASRRHET